jgi:Ca2+-binding EF-hand superfamily protein
MTRLKRCWCRFAGSIALVMVVGPAVALAADSPKEDSEALFRSFDADNDGQLSAQEIGNYAWGVYDKNGDGFVSKDEFLNGRAADKATAATTRDPEVAWKLLDWTNDGWLSGTELDGKYQRYDADGNGRVTKEEFLKGWKADRDSNPPKPAPQGIKWVEVDARNRGFMFKMPGEPKIDENGYYLVTLDNGQTTFGVSFFQGEVDLEPLAQERITAVRDALLKQTKGKLVGERRKKYDDRPSAELKIEGGDGIQYGVTVTIAGRWLCQMLMACGPQSSVDEDMAETFFDSLQVTLKSEPKPEPTPGPTPPPADGWQLVDASAQGFTFQMPGKPDVQSAGDYKYVTDDQATAFIVTIRTGDGNLEATADERLRNVKQAAADLTKSKPQSEKKITLDGHPGLAFTCQTANEIEYRYRVYLVNDRLCQLVVIRSNESAVSPAMVNRFFDSLKIVPVNPSPTPTPQPTPGGNNAGWVVTTLEFGFGFATPGNPQRDDDGNFVFTTDGGNTVYKVMFEEAATPRDAQQRAAEIRNEEAENLKGTASAERAIEQSGFPGREFKITVPGNDEVEASFHVLAADRLVLTMVVVRTANSTTGPADVRKFFNSLKILDPGTTPGPKP